MRYGSYKLRGWFPKDPYWHVTVRVNRAVVYTNASRKYEVTVLIAMPWAYCQIRNITGCACAARFSPPSRFSDPDMHQGTCVTHVPWCMPGSLTSGFLWNLWRGKRSRYSRCMHNPLFYVSGKRALERKTGIYCFHKTLNNIGTIEGHGTVEKGRIHAW